MDPIPIKIRNTLAADPFMKKCVFNNLGGCNGKVEWEHDFIYAGRQVQEEWAIIPVCVYHHRGAGLNKEHNEYIALNRAAKNGLFPMIVYKYPKKEWVRKLKYLETKFKTNA